VFRKIPFFYGTKYGVTVHHISARGWDWKNSNDLPAQMILKPCFGLQLAASRTTEVHGKLVFTFFQLYGF
jgi:hypothetical protein